MYIFNNTAWRGDSPCSQIIVHEESGILLVLSTRVTGVIRSMVQTLALLLCSVISDVLMDPAGR